MSFLVILVALLVERLTLWRLLVQRDQLWLEGLRRVERYAECGRYLVCALFWMVLLPSSLCLGLLGLTHGLLNFALELLVLLYSLGRLEAWQRGDREAAFLCAERDLAVKAESRSHLLTQVQAHLLSQAYHGFFAVIFWFSLFGATGALAYRLLSLLLEHSQQQNVRLQAARLRHCIDWIPVRLLALSFVVLGNMASMGKALRDNFTNKALSTEQFLLRVAQRDLDNSEGIEALHTLWQMLVRSAVLWYALLAAVVLL